VARVVLCGPGQMGIGALRAVIQHPGLELAVLGMPFGDNAASPPPRRALLEAIAKSIRKMAEASSFARDLTR
jgi:hypothetical protein